MTLFRVEATSTLCHMGFYLIKSSSFLIVEFFLSFAATADLSHDRFYDSWLYYEPAHMQLFGILPHDNLNDIFPMITWMRSKLQ